MFRYNRQTGRTAAYALLLVAAGAGTAAVLLKALPQPTGRIDEKTTLALLRTEAMSFLVTQRTTTQIVIEYQEGDWLGDWRGVLWATIRIHYGIDLSRVDAKDITIVGQTVTIRLPEPELLDCSMEPGSVGVLCKSTMVPRLKDLLENGHRRQLEQLLRQRVTEFAHQTDMMPSKAEIIRHLQETVTILKQTTAVEIHFK